MGTETKVKADGIRPAIKADGGANCVVEDEGVVSTTTKTEAEVEVPAEKYNESPSAPPETEATRSEEPKIRVFSAHHDQELVAATVMMASVTTSHGAVANCSLKEHAAPSTTRSKHW